MRQMARWIMALLTLAAGGLRAQDVTGTWQGTLGTGPQAARLVLHLAREGDGRLSASLFNPGRVRQPGGGLLGDARRQCAEGGLPITLTKGEWHDVEAGRRGGRWFMTIDRQT